jgi:antitoxin CptB
MRELDQLLGWYLDARYAQAAPAEQAAFSSLLEQPDPDLWSWLIGQSTPQPAEWRSLIDEIRSRDHV